jgi:rfaE bifunctional protein nucleotidyltransferase chain/domain
MTQIISLEKLVSKRQQWPKTKVILVTGCFDLLHAEHKKLLQAAKKQGEILLVGLESDKRVRQLKGLSRPVNPIVMRLKNLAGREIADYVFSLPEKFSSFSAHQKLISQLKPDILAVSSHTPNLAAKKKILAKYGGRIKIVLPHNPKVSSTLLLLTSR